MAAINAQSGTTGVSAARDTINPAKIILTGKSDGSSFTVALANPASSGFAATPTTSSIAATLVGGVDTPAGTPFTLPANAVAATVSAGTA